MLRENILKRKTKRGGSNEMCARWRCMSYHDGSVDEDHPERVLGEEAAAECRYLLRRPLVIVVRIISSSSSIIRWFHRALSYNFCERRIYVCHIAMNTFGKRKKKEELFWIGFSVRSAKTFQFRFLNEERGGGQLVIVLYLLGGCSVLGGGGEIYDSINYLARKKPRIEMDMFFLCNTEYIWNEEIDRPFKIILEHVFFRTTSQITEAIIEPGSCCLISQS